MRRWLTDLAQGLLFWIGLALLALVAAVAWTTVGYLFGGGESEPPLYVDVCVEKHLGC